MNTTNLIDIKINGKSFFLTEQCILNNQSELLSLTLNNIKNDTFKDNNRLVITKPNGKNYCPSKISDIIKYIEYTDNFTNIITNLDIKDDHFEYIINNYYLSKIFMIPTLTELLKNKINTYIEQKQINSNDVIYQNKISILYNFEPENSFVLSSYEVTCFKVCYRSKIYCLNIANFNFFTFNENIIMNSGYYIFDILKNQTTYFNCDLTEIYNLFLKYIGKIINDKLLFVKNKLEINNIGEIIGILEKKSSIGVTIESIHDLTIKLINLFDFNNDIINQINDILSYKNSIKFYMYCVLDEEFNKKDLLKYVNVKETDYFDDNLHLKEIYDKKINFKNKKLHITIRNFNFERQQNTVTEINNSSYDIHDNGGRPFVVKFVNNEVHVYGNEIINKKEEDKMTCSSENYSINNSDDDDCISEEDNSEVVCSRCSCVIDEGGIGMMGAGEVVCYNCVKPKVDDTVDDNDDVDEEDDNDDIDDEYDDDDYDNNNSTQLIKISHYKKIFIGIDNNPDDDGNSILIQLSDNKYVSIGFNIVTFEIDDQIINHYSPIGNNDVPYPYFVGEKNTYLILENQYISNDKIINDGTIDYPYNQYYDNLNNNTINPSIYQSDFKNFETKVILRRFYDGTF